VTNIKTGEVVYAYTWTRSAGEGSKALRKSCAKHLKEKIESEIRPARDHAGNYFHPLASDRLFVPYPETGLTHQ